MQAPRLRLEISPKAPPRLAPSAVDATALGSKRLWSDLRGYDQATGDAGSWTALNKLAEGGPDLPPRRFGPHAKRPGSPVNWSSGSAARTSLDELFDADVIRAAPLTPPRRVCASEASSFSCIATAAPTGSARIWAQRWPSSSSSATPRAARSMAPSTASGSVPSIALGLPPRLVPSVEPSTAPSGGGWLATADEFEGNAGDTEQEQATFDPYDCEPVAGEVLEDGGGSACSSTYGCSSGNTSGSARNNGGSCSGVMRNEVIAQLYSMGKWKTDERTERKMAQVADLTLELVVSLLPGGIPVLCAALQEKTRGALGADRAQNFVAWLARRLQELAASVAAAARPVQAVAAPAFPPCPLPVAVAPRHALVAAGAAAPPPQVVLPPTIVMAAMLLDKAAEMAPEALRPAARALLRKAALMQPKEAVALLAKAASILPPAAGELLAGAAAALGHPTASCFGGFGVTPPR